jgi:hypothetical protein
MTPSKVVTTNAARSSGSPDEGRAALTLSICRSVDLPIETDADVVGRRRVGEHGAQHRERALGKAAELDVEGGQ